MTTRVFVFAGVMSSLACVPALAGDREPVPVPVRNPAAVAPIPPEGAGGTYEQRLYGPGASLVAPEKAQDVVQAFRSAYEKLGKPRIAFYVNRDLVNESAGLKLSGRTEKTETEIAERKSSFQADPNATKEQAGTPSTQVNVAIGGSAGSGLGDGKPGSGSTEGRTTKVTGENTYTSDSSTAPTLADRLTVREIETLFGRPFRAGGASLADQKVAASLIADRPVDHFTTNGGEAARKDREALSKIADVVVEILVSSREITVAGVAGDRTVSIPDIQVTAVRLSDSAVLGQASATDVLGRDRDAGRIAGQFDAREITEATALALLEDIAGNTR